MRGQEAGGKKKDGEREQTKPYTTIPSRGFAPGKLPLDRPHQGAVMLVSKDFLPLRDTKGCRMDFDRKALKT